MLDKFVDITYKGSPLLCTSHYEGNNGVTNKFFCIVGYKFKSLRFDYYVPMGECNNLVKALVNFFDDVIDCINGEEELCVEQTDRLQAFRKVFSDEDAVELQNIFCDMLNK